jgi:hypothetical protein
LSSSFGRINFDIFSLCLLVACELEGTCLTILSLFACYANCVIQGFGVDVAGGSNVAGARAFASGVVPSSSSYSIGSSFKFVSTTISVC